MLTAHIPAVRHVCEEGCKKHCSVQGLFTARWPRVATPRRDRQEFLRIPAGMFRLSRPEGPEGGRGIALHFLDLGTRGGGWSAPRPGRFTPGKDPVPIVQEGGWAPGTVWTCAKNLAPTGIRSPDRPARSQSR
jgi:hypothetical protein